MKFLRSSLIPIVFFLFSLQVSADYQDTATVLKVQTALSQQGLYFSALDGIYGPGTQEAIMAYQQLNALPVDGLITRELLTSLRLRPGGLPDLPVRKTEEYLLGSMDKALYPGRWRDISSILAPIAYEAYLPADWTLTESPTEDGIYTLIYESDPDQPQGSGDGIDMAVFQIIAEPDQAIERGMDFLTFVYEYYDLNGSYVSDTIINHFTGTGLTTVQVQTPAGLFLGPDAFLKAPVMDYTYLFTGRDLPGEALVVGFSARSRNPKTRAIIQNILSSIHRTGESRVRTPAPEPTATPIPLPTPTPLPGSVAVLETPDALPPIPEPGIFFSGEEEIISEEFGIAAPEAEFVSDSGFDTSDVWDGEEELW